MDGIKPASLLLPPLHYTELWHRVKRWDRERKSSSVFFLFLFHFFILFLWEENAAAGEACRRCFGFYCVSPSSRFTKDIFYLPPFTPSLPPLPHSGPLTSPLLLLALPPLRTFSFFISALLFPFIFRYFYFTFPQSCNTVKCNIPNHLGWVR